MKRKDVVIIGAGPAGLGCAEGLIQRKGVSKRPRIHILEKNDRAGGLARTYEFRGLFFDIGPHRFYTRIPRVLRLWKKVLGKKFRKVRRKTRIYYNGQLFSYPLRLKDLTEQLGVLELLRCAGSYVSAQLMYFGRTPKTFEEWITKHFGSRLFEMFFKTYTEKTWGLACSSISAKWASQRIKNLSIAELVRTSILGKKPNAKSLVHEFYYPENGSGNMYESWVQQLKREGVKVSLDSKVEFIYHEHKRIVRIDWKEHHVRKSQHVDYLFVSMPLVTFVQALRPAPPDEVITAANALYYRDHITVNLRITGKNPFPDQWLYIHSPDVSMARVTNYANFLGGKKRNQRYWPIAVEYFAFQKDAIWRKSDNQLIDLAKRELSHIGLVGTGAFLDGFVVRETESYPVYYVDHEDAFNTIKNYVNSFHNVVCIGRGGMYKYNNMDHAIESGILGADIFFHAHAPRPWSSPDDRKYVED